MVILNDILEEFKAKQRHIAYIKVELLNIHNFTSFEKLRSKIFKNLSDLDLLINQCTLLCNKFSSDELITHKQILTPIDEKLHKSKSNNSCSADFRKEYSPLVFYDDLKLNYSYNTDKAESLNNILVAPKSTDDRYEELENHYNSKIDLKPREMNKVKEENPLNLLYDYKDKIITENPTTYITSIPDSRSQTQEKQERSNIVSELIISITKDQELSQYLLNSNPLIIEDLIKPEATEDFIDEVDRKIKSFYENRNKYNIMYTSPVANRNKINSDGNHQYQYEKLNKTSASIVSKKSSNMKQRVNNSYSLSKEKFNNFTKKHPSFFDKAYQYGGKSISIINYPTKGN